MKKIKYNVTNVYTWCLARRQGRHHKKRSFPWKFQFANFLGKHGTVISVYYGDQYSTICLIFQSFGHMNIYMPYAIWWIKVKKKMWILLPLPGTQHYSHSAHLQDKPQPDLPLTAIKQFSCGSTFGPILSSSGTEWRHYGLCWNHISEKDGPGVLAPAKREGSHRLCIRQLPACG